MTYPSRPRAKAPSTHRPFRVRFACPWHRRPHEQAGWTHHPGQCLRCPSPTTLPRSGVRIRVRLVRNLAIENLDSLDLSLLRDKAALRERLP